jgi:hypothetical protein
VENNEKIGKMLFLADLTTHITQNGFITTFLLIQIIFGIGELEI